MSENHFLWECEFKTKDNLNELPKFLLFELLRHLFKRNFRILSNSKSTFDNCSLCKHSYTLPVPLNYLCNPCFKYWWYDWSNFCYNFFNSELLAETIHYFVFNFCFFTKFFKQKTCWLRAIIQAWSCLSYYTIIHPQG